MWGSHLGRRDPKPSLIGHGCRPDARSLPKTPPSCAPIHLSRQTQFVVPQQKFVGFAAYTPSRPKLIDFRTHALFGNRLVKQLRKQSWHGKSVIGLEPSLPLSSGSGTWMTHALLSPRRSVLDCHATLSPFVVCRFRGRPGRAHAITHACVGSLKPCASLPTLPQLYPPPPCLSCPRPTFNLSPLELNPPSLPPRHATGSTRTRPNLHACRHSETYARHCAIPFGIYFSSKPAFFRIVVGRAGTRGPTRGASRLPIRKLAWPASSFHLGAAA